MFALKTQERTLLDKLSRAYLIPPILSCASCIVKIIELVNHLIQRRTELIWARLKKLGGDVGD